MKLHPESFIEQDALGSVNAPYQPTFEFAGDFINESHKAYSTCLGSDGLSIELRDRPVDGDPIDGWLRREDALKLYELGYFAAGDILELGSYHGLSTSILSRANHDSPRKRNIYTVDLEPYNVQMTTRHLLAMGLKTGVTAICGDALAVTRNLAEDGRRFAFVFIDHSHAYSAVYPVCGELARVLERGAFCLFHDFNDFRNKDTSDPEYGVYQAVLEGLDPGQFEFCGIYGCAGLYRFNTG
jgi:hypothetical protein